MKIPPFLRHPVWIVLFIIIAVIAASICFDIQHDKRLKAGTYAVLVSNETNYLLRVYVDSQDRYLTRTLQPGADVAFQGLIYPVGVDKDYIWVESKSWDRPMICIFKGARMKLTSKLIANKKQNKKNSGKVITIEISIEWPYFSSFDGYRVLIKEVLPGNERSWWRRMIS